jgi:hypothetical protein
MRIRVATLLAAAVGLLVLCGGAWLLWPARSKPIRIDPLPAAASALDSDSPDAELPLPMQQSAVASHAHSGGNINPAAERFRASMHQLVVAEKARKVAAARQQLHAARKRRHAATASPPPHELGIQRKGIHASASLAPRIGIHANPRVAKQAHSKRSNARRITPTNTAIAATTTAPTRRAVTTSEFGESRLNPAGDLPPPSDARPFTIVVVNYQEPFLVPTINGLLTTKSHELIGEILIIDDVSVAPVHHAWFHADARIHIHRFRERGGLIRARLAGGNLAQVRWSSNGGISFKQKIICQRNISSRI